LGSFVEHLVLTGSSRLDGSGNTLDNRMTGNSARNVLDGKAGLDSMDGMEGGDVYLITSASDHTQAEISDSGSDGVDELRFAATKAQTLKLFAADTGLERIIIGTGSKDSAVTTGTTALNMDASEAGNALELTGNAGKNQLTGTAFNDVITGGKGGDILSGGKGADTFSFRSGDSSGSGTGKMDSLLDFTPGEDIIHFSSALSAVSSNDAASARMAALDGLTGIASFAEGSGLTLKDALADIGSAFKASGDKAGLFSLFQLDQQGDFYLLVSDGKSGIGSNDTVIRLVGVDSLQGYQLLNGDLLLTG
jgi:Ca2+-binding RTX toxin-like protein